MSKHITKEMLACETVFDLLREIEKVYKGNILKSFIDEWKTLTNYDPK